VLGGTDCYGVFGREALHAVIVMVVDATLAMVVYSIRCDADDYLSRRFSRWRIARMERRQVRALPLSVFVSVVACLFAHFLVCCRRVELRGVRAFATKTQCLRRRKRQLCLWSQFLARLVATRSSSTESARSLQLEGECCVVCMVT